MALQKQNIAINFSQGLDTKTDSKQVAPGRFLALQNSIFTKQGLLQKRNGFAELTPLPDTTSTFITTFNGNLTAVGTNLQAYASGSASWVNKGSLEPVELATLPLVRSNTPQSQVDSAIAPNGNICIVYTDNVAGSPIYKYVIEDSVTSQNIVAPTVITPTTGTVTGSPRVFLLGIHFVIVFTNNIAGTYHLQYIAINITVPTIVTSNVDITSQYTPATGVAWDGVVINNSLYLAWNSNGGAGIRMTRISSTLVQSSTVFFAGNGATSVSLCADATTNTSVIYVSFFDSGVNTIRTFAVNQNLVTILAPTVVDTGLPLAALTSSAQNGICTVFYEVINAYSYDASIPTHYINYRTITQAGVVGTRTLLKRSVGLASKSFIVNNKEYLLTIYNSPNQPTYFLIDQAGNIVAKLAYSNGISSYYTTGLPSVVVNDNVAQIPYFFKDLIASVNKNLNVPNSNGIYTQTGISLATLTIGSSNLSTAEIGNDLNLSGGFLWSYDGFSPVENGFFLFPDSVEVTSSTTGGLLPAATEYFYQVTYEWSDNQGNIFRSAPSIPVSVTTGGTNTNSNTINVPTLRDTYKISNPVKIVIYRWSVAQQIFYQVTSLTNPLLNDPTTDSVAYVDGAADSAIIGNNILYTTGAVLENIAAPATSLITLFNSRLFLVDAEDTNLLWFSKQVIEATPVEMSDLLTIFVAPTTGAQGSTGPITALSALDDKLIVFKKDAIYYINGNGPDNTGSNSQFSEPIFITATVGCNNQHSVVFMPSGLMFQSDKGIWLLGRDLSTNYIGAPVEAFTQDAKVLSALNIPGTNQVRFTMDSGITLMYDYFYGQWGTFTNIPGVSSTLYQSLHTYINDLGQVSQETPGAYLDNSNPVLMSFTSSWLNLAGVQGFERFYFMYLLGTYISPFKLQVQFAYDYNPSPAQTLTVTPDNATPAYGGLPLWGSSPEWGGPGNVFEARIFPVKQKCEAFQITINEFYDPTSSQPSGAGLTLSGMNIIAGLKKGYRTSTSARNFG